MFLVALHKQYTHSKMFLVFVLQYGLLTASDYRLHYHMMHSNYQRQQGILQPFIWHVEWTLRRFETAISP